MPRRNPRPTADLQEQLLGEIPHLRAYLRRLANGLADIEDLVQEVLTRSWKYRASFDPAGSLRGWLSRTALRVWLDHQAAQRRHPTSLGDATEQLVDARPHDHEHRDTIAQALAKLSPIERDVLLRFHRQRYSIREIADHLDIPAGTIKSHLHRARRKIAEANL